VQDILSESDSTLNPFP